MKDIVYRVPGKHYGPGSKTYDFAPVNSEEDLKQKLEEGWFNTLEEAVNGKAKSLKRARNEEGEYIGDDPSTPDVNEAWVEDSSPTRDEMEAKAKELGISFKKKTKDKQLLALIEERLSKD